MASFLDGWKKRISELKNIKKSSDSNFSKINKSIELKDNEKDYTLKKEDLIKPIEHHLKFIEEQEKLSKKLHNNGDFDNEIKILKSCAKYCLEYELISDYIFETNDYDKIIYYAKISCEKKISIIKKGQDTLFLKPHKSTHKDQSEDRTLNSENKIKSLNSSPPVVNKNLVLEIAYSYFDKVYEQDFRKKIDFTHVEKYINLNDIVDTNNNRISNNKDKRKLYKFLAQKSDSEELIKGISPLINKGIITNNAEIIETINQLKHNYELKLQNYKIERRKVLLENQNSKSKQKRKLHNYLNEISHRHVVITVLSSLIDEGIITNKSEIREIVKQIEVKYHSMSRNYKNKKSLENSRIPRKCIKSKREPIPNRVRHQVFQRDNYRCRECGARLEDGATLEIDHIVPVAKGGTNDISNLQTLCKACNRGKYTDIWIGGKR